MGKSELYLFVGIISAALLLLIVTTVLNSWFTERLDRPPVVDLMPNTHLLIPLRNECHQVSELIEALAKLLKPNLRILLLDDRSQDGTHSALEKSILKLSPDLRAYFSVIEGAELPAGWIGKSWACHQLAANADSEILIFCDADVRPAMNAVAETCAWLRKVDALSALPKQVFKTWLEQAVVPFVMHLPVFGFAPLFLVSRTLSARILVANGQWLAVRSDVYRRVGGHQKVRNQIVEDMALMREIKNLGLTVETLIATESLQVRMYRTPADLFEGFEKNSFFLVGGNGLSFFIFLCTFVSITIMPWAGIVFESRWLFPLCLLLLWRTAVANLAGSSRWGMVWHPVGSLLAVLILVRSSYRFYTGKITWKGRSYNGKFGSCGGYQ